MKKINIIAILLCTTALFTLVSCNNNPDNNEPPIVETEKFTVTFNSNGGSQINSQTIEKDKKITKPSDPSREGYTFDGWYKDAACTNSWNFDNDTVTANTTLYAKWTQNSTVETKYTVTFDSQGGSTVASMEVEQNSKVTQPENPTKNNYIFGGWYKDVACTTPWNFDTDKVTANTTLYAKWTPRTSDVEYYTITFNSQGGSSVASIEVEQNSKATKPADPTNDGYTFEGWYKDAACTTPWNFNTDTVTANITLYAKWVAQGGDNQKPVVTVVYGNGTPNGTVELVYEDGSYYIDNLPNPTKPYYKFGGWYTDETYTNKFNTNAEITESITLYAKWEVAYETVNTPFDYTSAVAQVGSGSSNKLTADTTFQSKFILGKGSYIDTTFINTQGKTIKFILSGENGKNKITFYASGASSSAKTVFTFYKEGDEGNPIKTWEHANKSGSTISLDNLDAGTYVLTTSVSAKIENLAISEELQQSPTSGIEVEATNTQTSYLVGSAFNTSGLVLNLVYENNRRDNIDVAKSISDNQLKIYLNDQLAPNILESAGVYTVKLVYNVSSTVSYEDTYTITVYAPVDIKVYDHTIDLNRITQVRQDVYSVGGTLNTSNLVVKALCLKTGTSDEYIEFLLNSSQYTVSSDLSTAGRKEVTVSYTDYLQQNHTTSYTIEVVTLPDTSTLASIEVIVDNTIAGAVVDLINGCKFATINQAMQFLALCDLDDECQKNVFLTAGQTYTEKVEITLPNLTLKTKDATDINNYAIITYNALNGILEPGETQVYSTDGSATVSIREEAVGFTAYNVYFMNYYNTLEKYNASKAIAGNGTQAVACLVQADMSFFDACAFSSFQDTLYAQVGRQYYENCYIEGRTDYIFGEDATAYFTNCTIHSIVGDSDKNGGYVATTKGSTGILYNYVFDGCNFTAAAEVTEGTVSIARGWAADMHIIVMNSTLGSHISKETYGDNTSPKNDRYGKMNADPVASQILEYNNTGAGAITESLDNTCTVLTLENVNQYIDLNIEGNIILSKVFTKDNGATKYTTSWAGPHIQENVTINIYNRLDENVATYKEFAGNYFETPKNLYEAGHHFVGWYTDQARTQAYDDSIALTNNQVLNLYAKYDGASTDHNYAFDIEPLKTALTDQAAVEQSHLTGTNAFLTRTSTSEGTVVYRKGYLEISDSYIYYLEVKKVGFAINFEGAGSITITFASTGEANASRIGIIDENGNFVTGQIVDGEDYATPTLITTGTEAGSYEVTGTKYATVKFTITSPGTYYIFVPTTVQNRATRVNSIVVVDNY